MGIRKSTGKNKKSKKPAAAVAVKRQETMRRLDKAAGRERRSS
jgi:hypothetical protein